MEQFSKRLSKLMSNKKASLNERDYTIVKSVSKQQFQQKKIQMRNKIKQLQKQNKKYLLEKSYQNLIKKFNNNLFLIKKLILQNKKVCQMLQAHPKMRNKINIFQQLVNQLASNKNILLFLDDIDEQIIQKIISGE